MRIGRITFGAPSLPVAQMVMDELHAEEREFRSRATAAAQDPGQMRLDGVDAKLDRIIELLELLAAPTTGRAAGYDRDPEECGYHDWTGPRGKAACIKCGERWT